MATPSKKEREQCWGARDLYWQCLDSNNNNTEKCATLRKQYESFCSKQWVRHFDRKRNYEEFKANLDESNWELPAQENK